MVKSVSFSPYGGDTIKALEARQKALQQSAPELPAVQNMRSPWQGAAYLGNQLVNTLQQNAAASQERSARQQLAQMLGGHAEGTSWSNEEFANMGQLDPEFMTHLMDLQAAKELSAGKTENWVPVETPAGETGQWIRETVTGDIKRVGGGADSSTWKPTDIGSLRDDYTKLASVYEAAAPSWMSMQNSFRSAFGKTGPGVGSADYDLVVGLAKILDPNSVVREGEVETVRATGGAADYLISYLAPLREGGNLSDDVRKGIMMTGQSRMQAHYDQAMKKYEWIAGIAERHGVAKEDVLPPMEEFQKWTDPGGVNDLPPQPEGWPPDLAYPKLEDWKLLNPEGKAAIIEYIKKHTPAAAPAPGAG